MRSCHSAAEINHRYPSARYARSAWIAWLATLVTLVALLRAVPAQAGDGPAQASDIAVRSEGQTTQVVVTFSTPVTFSARLESERNRLVVDVPNAVLKGAAARAITRPEGLVAGVLGQSFAQDRTSTARFWITMTRAASYSVRVEDLRLIVTLGGAPTGRDAAKRGGGLGASSSREPARVLDVRFDHRPPRDQLTIELSAAVSYQQSPRGPGKTALVLDDCRLPEELKRTLDTTAYQGPLARVSVFSRPQNPTRVVLEAEHAAGAQSRVRLEGRQLVWTFGAPGGEARAESGVGRDGGPARRTRTVHVEEELRGLPQVETGYRGLAASAEQAAAPDRAAAYLPAVLGQQRGDRYTGRRIDLDLKDADIHNVLRLLADVGRVNIVTSDKVSGAVTIKMRNIPWDQALSVILQAKGLGMVRQGNMIRVAPAADLDKERELEIARLKAEAKLVPLETRLMPVSYADAKDMQARSRDLLSSRGSIAVDERTNVLIVRDVAGNLNQIEELIRSLDTQTPQVLVEARIVEATSRYTRDVGIQWGGDATFSSATGNPTGLVFPSGVGMVGGASDNNTPTAGMSPFNNRVANPNFAVNLPAAVGTGSGGALGLTFGSIDNNINLGVRLSAAESSGMLRILSSPRVLTLDNHEARISQGTLLPFSQISAQGVQTTFQEAKLQLLVKPHVTADGSIAMKVKVNRDEPDFNQTSARGDPTILKREAETHLLIADGHTAVIGGIFTRNTGRNLDQVPFFGDIPILGLLFQRRRASDTRSELVIFLTPRIVNRAEALGR